MRPWERSWGIPPEAARAVFQAVFWKPAIRWQVTMIEIVNPVRWFSVMRNETGTTASPRTCVRESGDGEREPTSRAIRARELKPGARRGG